MVFNIPLDLFVPFQIRGGINLFENNLRIPVDNLPKQYIDNTIRVNGNVRCKLLYGELKDGGGHGSIYHARRIGAQTQEICVKVPHNRNYSLCSEAILQWTASETLRQAGIEGAVPHVYDIFQYAGETRFTMSYIKGKSSIDYIMESSKPQEVFIQILIQISLLLGYLEQEIHLDHRDLKADNIWIRNQPIQYEISLDGKKWKLSAPFQVVLLDFGFGCIGGSDGNAIISLSDGILPLVDPCPKEGRDIFQLIASLWSCPPLRALMDEPFKKEIEDLISYRNKPYSSLAKQTLDTRWIYLLVSDSSFKHPPLHPLSLLRVFSIKYGSLYISSE